MEVIVVGPWMLSSQIGLDQGCRHALAMDALFAKPIGLWTSSWLGHGCSFLFSESVRPWRRGDVRFRPKFDETQARHGCTPYITEGPKDWSRNCRMPSRIRTSASSSITFANVIATITSILDTVLRIAVQLLSVLLTR